MNGPFVAQISLELADKLKNELVERGCTLEQPAHTLFQAKKEGLSCTLYTSGKLVVQGKKKDEFIEYYLEPEILHTFTYRQPTEEITYVDHIGSDESGKGDYFGPLCIAALYATKEQISQLIKMGVKDSKKLTDATILSLAKKIEASFTYHIIKIGPSKYNELIEKFGNLNSLMGWAHATAIDALYKKTQCKEVTIDKFAHESVVTKALKQKELQLFVIQKVRAEEDPVVAGASILARASFVQEMARLSTLVGMVLPKGASKKCIEVGKAIVRKHGTPLLAQVAKMHFKTTQNIFD
jgi:ribonuclease HIII